MAGIDSKMAGIATYLPHFFLDSGISTWTIFYGTRTTTTTTTSLNHLYIRICWHTFSGATAKLAKSCYCTSHIFGIRGLFVPFFQARHNLTYVEVYLCPLIPNYVYYIQV